MSWLKPSVYILALLMVVFGGALLLDQAAPMLGLTKWLPSQQQAHVAIEIQYLQMWLEVRQTPPDSADVNHVEENLKEGLNNGNAASHLDVIKQ